MSLFTIFTHNCREEALDNHLHDLLHHVIHQNEQILHNQEIIMASTQDLDTSIGTVEASLTKLGTDLKQAISDLEAKIASNPPTTFDPAPEIARLSKIADAIGSLDTAAVAADPGPQTPPAPTLATTTTTLNVSGPSVANSPITFEGTVVGGDTVPTGTVVISATNVVDSTASLDATGAFSATLTALPAGMYDFTAKYSGDSANEPSTGNLTVTVTDVTEA